MSAFFGQDKTGGAPGGAGPLTMTRQNAQAGPTGGTGGGLFGQSTPAAGAQPQ